MKEIQIFPIFNQTPEIWKSFAHIAQYTLHEIYGLQLTAQGLESDISSYERGWDIYRYNYAFVALDEQNMIGFIRGCCIDNVATIASFYILPEYRKSGTGHKMITCTEAALSCLGITQTSLVAMGGAESFYRNHGYQKNKKTGKLQKEVRSKFSGIVPAFYANDKIAELAPDLSINKEHHPCFIQVDNEKISGLIANTANGPVIVGGGINHDLSQTMDEFIQYQNTPIVRFRISKRLR